MYIIWKSLIQRKKEVYNIELENLDETKTITLDSLDRKQVKATLKSKVSIKSQGKVLARTLDKAQKGSEVIVIDQIEGKTWVKVRTENGKIGYIKTDKLENITTVREEKTEHGQWPEPFWQRFFLRQPFS